MDWQKNENSHKKRKIQPPLTGTTLRSCQRAMTTRIQSKASHENDNISNGATSPDPYSLFDDPPDAPTRPFNWSSGIRAAKIAAKNLYLYNFDGATTAFAVLIARFWWMRKINRHKNVKLTTPRTWRAWKEITHSDISCYTWCKFTEGKSVKRHLQNNSKMIYNISPFANQTECKNSI